MNIKKIASDTKAIIKKGWTTGSLARDEKGHQVSFQSDEAVCWCLMGALLLASNDLDTGERLIFWAALGDSWDKFLRMMNKAMIPIHKWNDAEGVNVEEVNRFLDYVIDPW